MDAQCPAAAANGDPLISYARCSDARTFVVRTPLSHGDRQQLHLVFERLAELGIIALPVVSHEAENAASLEGVFAHLRHTLGDIVVDAAVAAATYPATPVQHPQGLIPIWQFEPTGCSNGELVATGLLFGATLEVYAVPAADDDFVPPAAMHALSAAIARGSGAAGTVRLPGHRCPYAVMATVKAG